MESSTDSSVSSDPAVGVGGNPADLSKRMLYPSQGQSIFIVNPFVVPPHGGSVKGTNTINSQIPLQSVSVQMVNPNYVTGNASNGNECVPSITQSSAGPLPVLVSNGYSHFLHTAQQPPLFSRQEATVDFEDGELSMSLVEAYKYTELVKSSLQSAVFQMSIQLQESEKEKAKLNAEIVDLEKKYVLLAQEKDKLEKQLEERLAQEQNESKKLRQEVDKCNDHVNKLMKDAKLKEECLKKEKEEGNKKTMKIQEAEITINKLMQTCNMREHELKQVREINQQIIDEYWAYFTQPTTLNKLVQEQLATKSSTFVEISNDANGNTADSDQALVRLQDTNLKSDLEMLISISGGRT